MTSFETSSSPQVDDGPRPSRLRAVMRWRDWKLSTKFAAAMLVPVLFAEATRFLPNFYSPQFVNASRYIVVGILLILIVRFRPQGLLAERKLRIPKHKLLAPAASIASPGSVAPDHTDPIAVSSLLSPERPSSESKEAHNGK